MPSACAATLGRDLLSDASRIFRPSPGLPSRLARGTRQLSKASVAVLDAAHAPSCLPGAPTVKPGVPFSTISAEIAAARVVDLAPLAEQQVEVGDVAVGDEGLAAVDDDVVAVRREARRHAGGVRAGVRLGDGERAEPAFGDARQQALLLLLGAEVDQRLHAVEVGGADDAGRGAGLGDDRARTAR